jgi:hypothetical protein
MNINVLVDWGKSFVDKEGSFYCGTTDEQKEKAVQINQQADMTIYFADVHSRSSSEFSCNGGLYPAHNLVKKDAKSLEDLDVESGKVVSPELTDPLQYLVKDRSSGLIVPRHVFFQDYNGEEYPRPCFSFEDVEETFGVQKLKPQEFLDGRIDYIINAKHMFNGAGYQVTDFIGEVEGVPSIEMNALTLLKQKYGQGQGLNFDVTGVVMGICIYQTASGIKQIFPKADVSVISDACTHLIYEPLGIPDESIGNDVAQRMCAQVGINYLSTEEYLRR